MTLIQQIDRVIAEKSLLKHPFYVAWTEGKLTKAMLREYAKQYYHHEAAFPTYLSAIHSNCPDIKIRQVILDNMREEEMGEKNHPALWLQFANALGLSKEEVTEAEPLPETSAMINTFRMIARSRSTVEGLGAMYAYEVQIPEIARIKIEGLKKWYGIEKPEDIEFFTVHEKADEWHSQSEREIFLREATTEESKKRLVQAISEACDALNLLLDGVYRRFCQKHLEGSVA